MRGEELRRARGIKWLVSLAVLFGMALAFPAAGQIEVRSKPPTFQKARDGEVIPVIVVAEGAKIRERPSRTAASVSRGKFLDVYFLLETAEEAGKRFFLAGTMDSAWRAPDKIVGWLAEDDVLVERQAIKEKHGIFLKGLVVNQWRDLSSGGSGSGLKISGADLLVGPGKDASGNPYSKTAEIGLFSFYFIFAKYEAPGGQRYVLLGESPIINNVTQPRETLVGWADARRIQEWSTRQAVQFDKTTLPKRVPDSTKPGAVGAKIFATEQEVIADLRGVSLVADEELQPVAVEDPRVTHWQHNWPRFPLFEVKPNREIPAAGALYHVGFIGDQIYVSGRSGASSGVVAENVQNLDKLRTELKGIDLLFVIDSTGSMRNYFKTAADAVLKIAKEVGELKIGDQSPNIRYSVVFYRDYVDEDGAPDPTDTYLTKRLPFTGNQSAVAKFLRDEEQMLCNGCGGDEPEAVFYGIEYAINTAAKEPSDDVGLRALILMGDKGNHLRDARNLDTARVAKAIKDQRYDFFCFHVVDASWLDRDSEARAFQDQCTDISRKVELTSQTKRLTSKRPAEIAAAIVEAARSVATELITASDVVGKVSRGEVGLIEARQQYGVRLTQRLSDMMEERGIDPKLFIEKSAQVFEQGWVAEKDPLSGARQIETVLLVDRATLEQLQGLLAGLTKAPPSKSNVEALWTKVLQEVTQGEPDLDKSVAELIENHLGIPIREKLLAKTLREIANLSPGDLNRLYSELQLDLHRVRGLQAEKQLEIKQTQNGTGGFEITVKELGTRPVWWQGKGNKEYAWIPADELP